MEEKISIPKKITDFETVQKVTQDLEQAINNILKKVAAPAEFTSSEGQEGDTGDTKIIRNTDKTYTFSIKTEDGWKSPSMDNREIRFTDLPKVEKNIKKSITKIETDDIATGASTAKKTIFDEKAGKFIMPRPDYDSGWFVWDHSEVRLNDDNPHVLTHNLGVIPFVAKIWFAGADPSGGSSMSSGANPTISTSHGSAVATSIINWATPIPVTYSGDSHDEGVMSKITSTTISLIASYDNTIKTSNFNSPATYADYDDGYIRVFLWK